jgi:ATP-dependent Clp protease protease subunit
MEDEVAANLLDNIDFLGKYILKEGIDPNNRIILVNTDINRKTADKFIKSLRFLECYSGDPITIHINCPGGSVYDGLSMIDAIRTSSCQVITVGTGLIASMALPLLASGDIRKATANSFMMCHEISYSHGHERLSTTEIESKHTKILNVRLNKLLAQYSFKPYHFWARVGKHVDYYMDADKALELGLIDEIIEEKS